MEKNKDKEEVRADAYLEKVKHYKSTFSGAGSDFVLKDLMKECNFLQSSFTAGEPHLTSYFEGKRSVILYIIGLLDMSEGSVQKLAKVDKENKVGGAQEVKSSSIAEDFSRGLF